MFLNIKDPTQIFWEIQITQPLLELNNGKFGNYNSNKDQSKISFYVNLIAYYRISFL